MSASEPSTLKTLSSGAWAQFDLRTLSGTYTLTWARRDWGLASVLLAGYLLLAWFSVGHTWSAPGLAPWSPQLGFALAFVLIFGVRFLPVFAFAVLVAEFLIHNEPVPLMYRIMEVIVVSAAYAFAAILLAHLLNHTGRIRSLSELMATLVVATLTPLVIGLFYFGALANVRIVSWSEFLPQLRSYWISDALGIVATLPALLHAASARGRQRIGEFLCGWESLLQLAVMVLLLGGIFAVAEEGPIRYFFIMFIPLLWIAVRHGQLGAGLALLVLVLSAIVSLQLRGPDDSAAFAIQVRSLALGITALVLGVIVDERRRAQQRLQQSMRLAAAGEMAAALAHELNQPLTALVNYGKACQILLAGESTDKQALNQTVDKIALQGQRIATIVSRLRDFLRSGRMNLEHVAVADLIATARASAEGVSDGESVEIQAAVPVGLPAVYVDRAEIEIVLRNLLANAVDSICHANVHPRLVRIEARVVQPTLVRISVIDSGPGVSAEIRDRLFSPFETTKAHGMGMGLAVSRAIVEAHGGQLWTEPTGFGVFHLTLPTDQGDANDD